MTQAMSTHLGEALGTDFFSVREQFTDEQWTHFITVRKPRLARTGTGGGQPTITSARSDKISLEQNGRWFTVLRRITKTSGCQGRGRSVSSTAATGSRTM